MKKTVTVNLTGTALCLALGFVFPSFFHMFGAGTALLPMHIPVLLCGLTFGWQYGAVCGFILPFLSAVITGMPPLFPTAAAMMFELCAYGTLTGIFYRKLRWNVYPALICAMLGGRMVSGAANAVFMDMAGKPYGLAAFFSVSFIQALPGIFIQIILIPILVMSLEKAKIIAHKKMYK